MWKFLNILISILTILWKFNFRKFLQAKNAFEFCKELQLTSAYAEISDDVIWHQILSKKKFKQFLKNLKNAGIVFGVDLAPGIFPRDIFDLEELTNEAPPTFHNIFE